MSKLAKLYLAAAAIAVIVWLVLTIIVSVQL